MPVYTNDFMDLDDVCREFSTDAPKEVNILYADYTYQGYDGEAFVLYEKDGEYYEVNGAHCSCYGLEGQWEPEKTDLLELKHRVENCDASWSIFYKNNKLLSVINEVLNRV